MELPARRSIRWKGYDYSQVGLYYVTICTHDRRCTLGRIQNGRMILNRLGAVVRECWVQIPYHFARVDLDAFVIMPNHLHCVLVLHKDWRNRPDKARAQRAAPLHSPGHSGTERKTVAPRSLAAVVRSFKAAVTKESRERGIANGSVWQRNYYEHVVRDGKNLAEIRRYIDENPGRWGQDEENPEAQSLPSHYE